MDITGIGTNMTGTVGMAAPRKNIKPAETMAAGIDTGDKLTSGVEQKDTTKELQDKIKTMKKEARKGYLLGVAGTLALALAGAFTGLASLGLAAGGAVALFKGSQIIHDKVMNA